MSSSQRTIKLITVNTAPERAKLLIGRFAKRLPSKYVISYVDNCSTIGDVAQKLAQHQPDVLFSASMWTPDEAQQIHEIARSTVPNIKTHAIPTGLQVEQGPDAVVEYLVATVEPLLEQWFR